MLSACDVEWSIKAKILLVYLRNIIKTETMWYIVAAAIQCVKSYRRHLQFTSIGTEWAKCKIEIVFFYVIKWNSLMKL